MRADGRDQEKRTYYLLNREKVLARTKAYRLGNKEKVKRADKNKELRAKYGITLEEFEALLAVQNHKCALCKQPEKVKRNRLAVDHCHMTGKVRGLLCFRCNVILGHIENYLQSPGKIKQYLGGNSEKE